MSRTLRDVEKMLIANVYDTHILNALHNHNIARLAIALAENVILPPVRNLTADVQETPGLKSGFVVQEWHRMATYRYLWPKFC